MHVTLSPCCMRLRDAKSLSLQRCGEMWPSDLADLNPVNYSIWGILQESVYHLRIHNMKELEKRGGCTLSSRQRLRSGVVVCMHVFAWMVDILNINCEPLTFCCVLFVSSMLVSVIVIDINMCKVLILCEMCYFCCLRLSHSIVATQRMCGRKFLSQWLWHSLVKLCTKNYENMSIFAKVTVKKSVAPFLCGHSVYQSACDWVFGWLLHKPLCAFCKILTVGCIWNFPFLYNIKFCYQVQYTQMYNMHFSFWLPVRDKIKVHWGCSQMLLNAAGMDINDKPSIESCEVAREGTFPLFNVWSHGSCCVWCLECDAVVTDDFGQVAFVSERRAFGF